MVICLFYIICHHIFEWKHTFHIQISGSGNQILRVRILCRQLVVNQMTAVVEILSAHDIILDRVPATWLHRSDGSTFFCRHDFFADVRIGYATSSKIIQAAVIFKCRRCQFRIGEIRHIVVDNDIRTSGISRDTIQ